jgi:cyclophilin family peptidyl-prolyl cis-trans isomerase
MRILIIFLVLSKLIFAQYDSTMYDLIKTTYGRSFDKQIISKYLHSNSEQKIKASLLSIAQSEDTSFVPELLKLDLMKYGSDVCYAIAQIGNCNQSINFLWNYLYTSPPPNQFPKIFFAIGKIGNEIDLNKLIEFYNSFDGPIFPYEGISEAILQFQIRGIKSDDARAILETEITHKLSNKNRIEQGLFALARYSESQLTDSQIQNLFQIITVSNNVIEDDTKLRQFVLMNIKKDWNVDIDNLFIITGTELRKTLLKIGLAKVLHHFHYFFRSYPEENIKEYFELLNDENQNVALQTAISIKNIKNVLNDTLKNSVKNKIDSLLFDSTKSVSFKGELFLSRFELFAGFEEHQALLEKCPITSKYFMQFYAKNYKNNIAIKRLIEYYYFSSSYTYIIQALEEIVKIKDEIRDSINYERIILFALNSNISAPSISIAADGIDSIFIEEDLKQLKEIIPNQIDKYKDNPNFLEAIMSLVNLAERIDKDFYESMIEKVKSSKLYSIRKFVSLKTGYRQFGFKELDKFEDIWVNAFKYKQATINTSKGNVVIEFNSEIAPISVANFCMLAKQNFYNSIIFHRVVPGFVIQAGDPTATGWGGPGYDIVSEYSDTNFEIGYVGMASAGKDTESSQFFIMQGSHPHLDSRYTLFAKVIEGLDVVYNITEDDNIISIELH